MKLHFTSGKAFYTDVKHIPARTFGTPWPVCRPSSARGPPRLASRCITAAYKGLFGNLSKKGSEGRKGYDHDRYTDLSSSPDVYNNVKSVHNARLDNLHMEISLLRYSIVINLPMLTPIVINPKLKITARPIFLRREVKRPCSRGMGKMRSVVIHVSRSNIRLDREKP